MSNLLAFPCSACYTLHTQFLHVGPSIPFSSAFAHYFTGTMDERPRGHLQELITPQHTHRHKQTKLVQRCRRSAEPVNARSSRAKDNRYLTLSEHRGLGQGSTQHWTRKQAGLLLQSRQVGHVQTKISKMYRRKANKVHAQ